MLHHGTAVPPQLPDILGRSELDDLLHHGGRIYPDLSLCEAQGQADVTAHFDDKTERNHDEPDEDSLLDPG